MPRPTQTVKQTIHVTTQIKLKPTVIIKPSLEAKIEERAQVSAKLDQLTTKKKDLDSEILPLVERLGGKARAIDIGEWTVAATDSHSAVIKSDLLRSALHDAGVKATVIAACIEAATEKKPYTYPRYARKKDAEGGESADPKVKQFARRLQGRVK